MVDLRVSSPIQGTWFRAISRHLKVIEAPISEDPNTKLLVKRGGIVEAEASWILPTLLQSLPLRFQDRQRKQSRSEIAISGRVAAMRASGIGADVSKPDTSSMRDQTKLFPA